MSGAFVFALPATRECRKLRSNNLAVLPNLQPVEGGVEMKRIGLVFGLTVAAIACATGADMMGEILDSGVPDAGAETPGDGTSMQYVGNSTKEFRGDGRDPADVVLERGFFVGYAACQETFGPGHRTCTQQEILFTTKIPPPDERTAWYGVPRPGCDSANIRATVDTAGIFSRDRCAAELTIACCGPK
jgi:hypothetical protein